VKYVSFAVGFNQAIINVRHCMRGSELTVSVMLEIPLVQLMMLSFYDLMYGFTLGLLSQVLMRYTGEMIMTQNKVKLVVKAVSDLKQLPPQTWSSFVTAIALRTCRVNWFDNIGHIINVHNHYYNASDVQVSLKRSSLLILERVLVHPKSFFTSTCRVLVA